jgi:hypothetical protein
MNKQEVYNKVRDHLLKQNAKSKNDNSCAYRGDNGMMCAAGCLIPDELYNPDIDSLEDGLTWNSLVREHRKIANAISTDVEVHEFIRLLQLVHDEQSPERWEKSLMQLALEHGLQP